jgi:hypothetical protein
LYQVTVAKEKNRRRVLTDSRCSCPIGKSGYCSHVAFLLIQAVNARDHAITVTDTPAVWKNPNLAWNEFSDPVSAFVPQEDPLVWASDKVYDKLKECLCRKEHPRVHFHQVLNASHQG